MSGAVAREASAARDPLRQPVKAGLVRLVPAIHAKRGRNRGARLKAGVTRQRFAAHASLMSETAEQ
jgi:hypothetical protein